MSTFIHGCVRTCHITVRKSNWYLSNRPVTHSLMELNPSWEAANCAAARELPSILWNPEVHHRDHIRPPPVPILSQIDPIPTLPSYLSKTHFNFSKLLPPLSSVNLPYIDRLLTFHVPNLISIFFRLGRLSKESFQVRGFVNVFVTRLFFTVRSC
jgi:hypothetical protein